MTIFEQRMLMRLRRRELEHRHLWDVKSIPSSSAHNRKVDAKPFIKMNDFIEDLQIAEFDERTNPVRASLPGAA